MSENADANKLIEPDNMGRMNDPDGSAFINGICGDSMEMYLVIEKGIISDSKFFTDGCNSSRFCGATAQHGLQKESRSKTSYACHQQM